MNGYELTRAWFDFSFTHSEAKVHHTALFLWIVELNNRLGWKKEFGLPSGVTMEGLSIGNKNTYLSTLNDLAKWKFIEIIKESKNQYQASIVKICRVKSATALHTALDTALVQRCNNIDTGTDPIDKPLNNETNKQRNIEFDTFWDAYDKKKGKKDTLKKRWDGMTNEIRAAIMEYVPRYVRSTPDKKFRKDPQTFFNNTSWHDEIIGEQKPVQHELREPKIDDFWNQTDYEAALTKFKKGEQW